MRRMLMNTLAVSALGALATLGMPTAPATLAAISTMAVPAVLHASGTSPVADAAMQGDKEGVRLLLKQAVDVDAAQGDGMTALHWAAMRGDVDMAQMLMYAGANMKATTRIGAYTPLFLASQNGHAAVIEALLRAGADPKGADAAGTTPLMVAAASGHTDAVKALLDHGADVNAKESVRGETAVMFAAASNRADVIDLLVQTGADLAQTTKVVDLAALSRDGAEPGGFVRGNPPPPPKEEGPAAAKQPADGRSALRAEGQLAQGGTAAAASQPESPAEPGTPAAAAPGASPAAVPPAAGGGAARPGGPASARPGSASKKPQIPGVDRQYQLNELVAAQGGITPLLFAVRQGFTESVRTLVQAGADVNQVSAGDKTSPLLMAVINGQFDVAKYLLESGASPRLASENGATPLYAALNVEWAPKALYPQPRAYQQQKASYLEVMQLLLDRGADPNARLKKKVWYSGYSFDLSGVDEIGATPFWRAAYASDVDAMKLLVAHGADPNVPTVKGAGRPRTADADREVKDISGLPPIPRGGPGITPLQAAAGAGYGEGFAGNSHRFAPGGMLAAVKYLVDELHVDVNVQDHEGNTALHHAAARGDNEMILYLVSKGADVKLVNREGKTTADMANGPVQRIQPFPETIALLEKLGARNNHKCISC
jgi:ankyrin repeat protein